MQLLLFPIISAFAFLGGSSTNDRNGRMLSAMAAKGKVILVTGGNRGVGLAICNEILSSPKFGDDDILYLGSRNFARGLEVIESEIVHKAKLNQVKAIQIDVTDQLSVEHCQETIQSDLEDSDRELYAIVNNAGGYAGADIQATLDINIYGMKRVTEAFLPLIAKGGRIVNIGSAGGPNYVAAQPEDVQKFLTDKCITWEQCEEYMKKCVMEGATEGNEWRASYGLSKAMVNCYTMILARENKDIRINAVTPGYIETDLTRPAAERANKTPEEMGMKKPEFGAKAPVQILFSENVGHGWYYGSDAKRSPIDRYRSPGDPEYVEEE